MEGASPGCLNRRNSISLPAGLDQMEPLEYQPQLTPEEVRHDGYETSDTFSDGGISEAESSAPDSETPKIPIGAGRVRKKSVLPSSQLISKIEVDQDSRSDTTDITDPSPGNSITSVNSISSLLKEKLMMTLPRALKRRKKPKEYKLRGFVAMLFLAIVFLVGFAHVYYHQQVLQRAYFEKVRFNKDERILRLYNTEGLEIALGYLGVELPATEKVYHCLVRDQQKEKVCLEWMHKARLYISYKEETLPSQGAFRRYTFSWQSLNPSTRLVDCFENGEQHGHWYGGGRTLGMAWPVELGKVEMSPFVTGHIGRHRWGSVLKRYFINSRGVAIAIDSETPLYVSINAGEETRLCLEGRHDDFSYVTHKGLPRLNYSVYTSSNMKLLHSFLSEKSLWDGVKESDLDVINALISEPVWQIAPSNKHFLTESMIVNYTEDIIALGFLKQGHVLLNEHWQNYVGDLTIDPVRLPTMNDTIDIIRRRGFKIALMVQPFIATESINFATAVEEGLLVRERGRDVKKVPALTQYKSVPSAGMLDITNNKTVPWIHEKLKELVTKYYVDSFYWDLGTAYDIPQYYQFQRNLTNPDDYKTIFTSSLHNKVTVIGISGTISRPPAPTFVSLPVLPSTWESLQIIIPTILTYGIVGYPFLMPGPVGGDYLPPPQYSVNGNQSMKGLGIGDLRATNETLLPNPELYMRWLQLATFLPVVRYSHIPSEYTHKPEILELARVLTQLRLDEVNKLLKKYVQDALRFGVPLIRPLWMLDPTDSACHLVTDEFSVGDELIVAPILRQSTTEREVYLPAGVWKDGIDQTLRKGSRWLHSYKVPFPLNLLNCL